MVYHDVAVGVVHTEHNAGAALEAQAREEANAHHWAPASPAPDQKPQGSEVVAVGDIG